MKVLVVLLTNEEAGQLRAAENPLSRRHQGMAASAHPDNKIRESVGGTDRP